MWLWHNTQLVEGPKIGFKVNNRAFQYGDGIFETMVVKDGQLQHSKYHAERIERGTTILKLNFQLSFKQIEKRINFLLQKNEISSARVKMMIWRKSGGLFTPKSNNTEYLIMVDKYSTVKAKPQHLEISTEVKVTNGLTKNCKTLNALPYILAGLELKEKNDADDLILLDAQNNVCECISSNIFWIKGNKFFTPSLDTNCVAGVKRAFILDQLKEKGMAVQEVNSKIESLLAADHVFKTNVSGICKIKSIGGTSFSTTFDLPFD